MNWRKDKRKKKVSQWDRTPDLVSSEQGCGLVERTSVFRPRGRVFDPAVVLLFFFLSFIQFIFICFLLFVLFCFIYNISRTTHLREIIFPCTTHNERSFFIISIFNEIFKFKNFGRTRTMKDGSTALNWNGINLLLTQSQRFLCFLYSVGATFRPEN